MADEKKYYPAVAFHFKVKIDDIPDDDGDSRFQSVSGLTAELETENRKEGGENRFEHVLPLRIKYPQLVLKRGLISSKSLRKWCLDNINAVSNLVSADPSKRLITPKNLTVSMLNENHEEIMTWNIVHAWPKKWSIADLNAEQSAIAVETIELQYWYFTVKEKIMPIEIKELNIRINVNQGQQEQNTPPQEGSGNAQATPDKQELMAECVEQVMELLKNKQER